MFLFLTDIREQKNYEMRTQTSVDNTVNDLCYEIRFENCVKDKKNFFTFLLLLFFFNIFFEQKYYSWRHVFKIPKNLITSVFLPRQMLKNIDMLWQKPQMLHW